MTNIITFSELVRIAGAAFAIGFATGVLAAAYAYAWMATRVRKNAAKREKDVAVD